jgi:exopolysaccharide transport family protein
MLQSNQRQSDLSRAFGNAAPQPEGGGIGQLVGFAFGFLRRQYALILFVTVLALATSIIYLRMTPPTYTGRVNVLFGAPKAQFFQQQSIMADAPLDLAQLESQLQILRSKTIAISVINKLRLEEDSDFKSPDQRFGKFLRRVRSWFGAQTSEPEVRTADGPSDEVIGAFEDRLSANRVGFSHVIEISYNSSDPERAAQIANAVADAYIADQLNAKFEANRVATTWLQDRVRELGEQASTAERAINSFKLKNNIVAADGKLMDEQQVADLNGRLVAARTQTSDALARLNRYQAFLSASDADLSSDNPSFDAPVSDILSSPVITGLRQQYLELARREADFSRRYGRDHLAVVSLRARMRDIRTSILDEVRRFAETSKSDYEVAKQRQDEIEKQLSQAVSQSRTTNSASLTVRELENSAKGYRNLYENFLQRYMGSVQQESFPIADARVISPASVPQSKSKPKTGLILALGLLGGLGLGTALGLLRDVMDRVFRTSSQVESVLQIPCLAMVPLLNETHSKQMNSDAKESDKGLLKKTLVRGPGVFWSVVDAPLSRFAESIRSVKLAIDLNATNPSHTVIGITSALPNEGKTTISASLAQLIAQAGGRVILVDCDFRNPSLSRSLAPKAISGILEVISGKRSLEETVWSDQNSNLSFLPAVKKAPLFHTSEILASEATKKLFDKLRTNFDYVVVDLPPLAPVVDVRAAAHFIDCFMLTVEWGRTKIDVVQHALNSAPNVHEALIGVVLNKTDIKSMKRYDNYHSDYYDNKYYARYGYTDT